MNKVILLIVAVYLLSILGVSIYSSRKIRNTSDYLTAGRRLGPFLLAATLAATAIDGGSAIGVVANTYGKWGGSAIWYIWAMGIAFVLLSFLAPVLRRSDKKTVPGYFCFRYGKAAGFLSAVLLIISLIGLTAAQLKVSASILEVMLGMDYNTSLLLVAVVITVYSMLGGLWSIALTDFIQFILIVAGMCAAVPFALRLAGGWEMVKNSVAPEALSLTAGIGGWSEILGYVLLFFMAFTVGEEVAICYYASENEKAVRRGSLIAAGGVFFFAFLPVILGIIISALYNRNLLNAGVMSALDQSGRYALPALAVISMPSAIVGLLFAGILSATMSSADSALLGAASIYGNDIYKVFFRPDADERRMMDITRVSMVFFMLFSFFTAIYAGNILHTIAFSLALRAAGSFIPYVMGRFGRLASRAGCLASLLVGPAVYLAAQQKIFQLSPIGAFFPAIGASAVLFFLFGRLLPDKDK